MRQLICGLFRRVLQWAEQPVLTRRYGHEMGLLLQAEERMLKDIGLTRGDVQTMIGCGAMAKAAVRRRNEAMDAADQRRALAASAHPEASRNSKAQRCQVVAPRQVATHIT